MGTLCNRTGLPIREIPASPIGEAGYFLRPSRDSPVFLLPSPHRLHRYRRRGRTPGQTPEQMAGTNTRTDAGTNAGTDTGTGSRPPASPDTMSATRAEGPLAAGVRTVCRAPEACAGHRGRHAAKRLRQVRKAASSPAPEAPRKDHREDRLPTVRCGIAPSPGAPQRENGSRRRISALRPERTYDPAAETAR